MARVDGTGYHFERVQPVDMFPHTTHVETVVVLARGGRTERAVTSRCPRFTVQQYDQRSGDRQIGPHAAGGGIRPRPDDAAQLRQLHRPLRPSRPSRRASRTRCRSPTPKSGSSAARSWSRTFVISPIFGWLGDRLLADEADGGRRRRSGAWRRPAADWPAASGRCCSPRGRWGSAKRRTPPSRRRSSPTTTRPSGAVASSPSSTWPSRSAAPSATCSAARSSRTSAGAPPSSPSGLPGLLLALLTLTAPDPPRGINDEPAASRRDPAGSYLHSLLLLARNRDYVMAVARLRRLHVCRRRHVVLGADLPDREHCDGAGRAELRARRR